MREFKFRAFENGIMYYQVRCGGIFDGVPTAPTVWNENMGNWFNLTGQPYTKIMQYTGLKDKNGVEIYEGDIVKGTLRIDDWVFNQKVHYLNGCYMFGNWNAHEYFNKHTEIQVVGNIYENKELLNYE